MQFKKTEVINGVRVKTREARLWYDMMNRCESGGKCQARQPAYVGCFTSTLFQDFQLFAGWCHSQVGFGLKGHQLDKDILVEGNKEYSEDVCVFVPQELNKFLTLRAADRGNCPLGVYWREEVDKYVAIYAHKLDILETRLKLKEK